MVGRLSSMDPLPPQTFLLLEAFSPSFFRASCSSLSGSMAWPQSRHCFFLKYP